MGLFAKKVGAKFSLECLTGADSFGQDYFVYLLCNRDLAQYMQTMQGKNVNPNKLGIVVLSGKGKPSANTDSQAKDNMKQYMNAETP